MGDDDAAKRERARRLREQIREKTSSTPPPAKGPETPRDFVDRRMREKHKGEKGD